MTKEQLLKIKEYEKLLKTIEDIETQNEKPNYEIYLGNPNGLYDYKSNKTGNATLDHMETNGNIKVETDREHNSYLVENATYATISTYKTNVAKKEEQVCENLAIFIDKEEYKKLQEALELVGINALQNKETKNISDYELDEEKHGLIIYPSEELIKENKSKTI